MTTAKHKSEVRLTKDTPYLALTGVLRGVYCENFRGVWPRYNDIAFYKVPALKGLNNSWWRHQMETFSALLALCAVNSPHKGQWRGALMFTLICARINDWVNNREAGDLRRHLDHYDVRVMPCWCHHHSHQSGVGLYIVGRPRSVSTQENKVPRIIIFTFHKK